MGKESTQEDIRWKERRRSVREEDQQCTDVDVRRTLNNDSNKDTKTALVRTYTKTSRTDDSKTSADGRYHREKIKRKTKN